ncbi:MAG: hypothetical protein SWY16_21855 [Cyanobacteriota bacterium]|nr:hypothetical protein [Cyanobacteriota bacterium]
MLTHHRKPACLSLVSTDLPIWSVVETAATLYQKDAERFHVLLSEPAVRGWHPLGEAGEANCETQENPRLLWLEISPYRTIVTMQHKGTYSYRHLLERGMYGISRYWLRNETDNSPNQMRLRNYTRSLTLSGYPFPEHLRLEYELWTGKVRLGRYVLNLEIQH